MVLGFGSIWTPYTGGKRKLPSSNATARKPAQRKVVADS